MAWLAYYFDNQVWLQSVKTDGNCFVPAGHVFAFLLMVLCFSDTTNKEPRSGRSFADFRSRAPKAVLKHAHSKRFVVPPDIRG